MFRLIEYFILQSVQVGRVGFSRVQRSGKTTVCFNVQRLGKTIDGFSRVQRSGKTIDGFSRFQRLGKTIDGFGRVQRSGKTIDGFSRFQRSVTRTS